MQSKYLISGLALAVLVAWMVAINVNERGAALAQDQEAEPITLEPVETDMHEFMEYAFQPTYLRLKQTMATEPADNEGWNAIKSDALILSEGGNLILMRPPEDDVAAWQQHATAVRQSGAELYAAGKKKDFAAARQHYQTMLTKCNSCHDTFSGGEPQLEP